MATVTPSASSKPRPPLSALALHVLALASCGGKEAGITTGLPRDALLGELTAEQAASGCGRLLAQVNVRFDPSQLAQEQCTLFALERTMEQRLCAGMRDTCLMRRAESDPEAAATFFEPTAQLGCGDPSARWRACTATVGALELCLREVVETYDDALDRYTCVDAPTYRHACLPPLNPYVAMDEIDPRTGLPPMCELLPVPDACRALEELCPGVAPFAR
jgi:hypothetical protein